MSRTGDIVQDKLGFRMTDEVLIYKMPDSEVRVEMMIHDENLWLHSVALLNVFVQNASRPYSEQRRLPAIDAIAYRDDSVDPRGICCNEP